MRFRLIPSIKFLITRASKKQIFILINIFRIGKIFWNGFKVICVVASSSFFPLPPPHPLSPCAVQFLFCFVWVLNSIPPGGCRPRHLAAPADTNSNSSLPPLPIRTNTADKLHVGTTDGSRHAPDDFINLVVVVVVVVVVVAAQDLALNSNVQDAFVIAVEAQARERLERLSALNKIKPVDMTQLSQQVRHLLLAPLTTSAISAGSLSTDALSLDIHTPGETSVLRPRGWIFYRKTSL